MKKSNLIKLSSILLIAVMLIMFATSVFAVETVDLTSSLGGNTNNTNTNDTNTNTNTSNTNSNISNTNTNNSSIYNNTTNLPKTGISDSIPVAMLVVVFGISAVYAYKKVKEYKNI